MKLKFIILSIIMAIIILAANLIMLKPPGKERELETITEHPLQVMAFFENGWGGIYGDSFPGFQENYQFIDVLSPFWYSLDNAGRVRVDRSRSEVLDFSQSKGVPVIPLVTNWQGKSGRFLTEKSARRAALANLMNLARQYQYPGLNLDVEYLPPSYKEPLVQFVQELHRLLAEEKKQLYVCVFPQVDFPESRSGLHDYQRLAAASDGLILMAYDHHRPGTRPGPVAALIWVENNIQNALKTVPSEKLWLGIPGYGYRWSGQAKTTAIPAWKAEADAREQKITVQWDLVSQTPYYTMGTNNTGGVVWYEDKRSAREKLKLARKYKLKGVALWRLGYEVKDFWGLVGENDG